MAAGWQNLSDVIFSEIMMTVGLESLGVLQKCRGVCKTWNVLVCQMTSNKKKAIIREAEDLVARLQAEVYNFSPIPHKPLLPEISTIAYLAHHTLQNIPHVEWLLWSVGSLVLEDVDLDSVPTEHLASLASCVDFKLHIINVHSTLINILDNIKSEYLVIKKQCLGSEETQAMVRAMKSRVKNVELHEGVSLDLTTLTQYSGHGTCEWVWCYGDTADKYREGVRTWGQMINWSLHEAGREIQIEMYVLNIQNIRYFKDQSLSMNLRPLLSHRFISEKSLGSILGFVPGQP